MEIIPGCGASGLIMNRGIISAYLPFLIGGFDRIGLTMRPAVIQPQVARLDASYIADSMHLIGELRNIVI